MPKQREVDIQKEIIARISKHQQLDVIHYPAGGPDKRWLGMQLRAGAVVGFPDLMVFKKCDDGILIGLLEVKRPGGKLSDAQKGWKNWTEQNGGHWACIHSADEAEETLRSWRWIS